VTLGFEYSALSRQWVRFVTVERRKANSDRRRHNLSALRTSSLRSFAVAAHRRGPEHREPSPSLSYKSTLHAKSLPLPPVSVDTGVKVESTAVVLQVVDELMDGNVILGGVCQVLPQIDDVAVLIKPVDRTWNVVLARPMTEPDLRFPLNLGQAIGERIARQLGGPCQEEASRMVGA